MGVHTIKCVGARVRRRFIINMAVIKWVLKQISLKCLLLGTNKLVKETFEEIHDKKTDWQDLQIPPSVCLFSISLILTSLPVSTYSQCREDLTER